MLPRMQGLRNQLEKRAEFSTPGKFSDPGKAQ